MRRGLITILLVVDLCSSLAYFVMLPIASKMPIKTLVATQLPTNACVYLHVQCHAHVLHVHDCTYNKHVGILILTYPGLFTKNEEDNYHNNDGHQQQESYAPQNSTDYCRSVIACYMCTGENLIIHYCNVQCHSCIIKALSLLPSFLPLSLSLALLPSLHPVRSIYCSSDVTFTAF